MAEATSTPVTTVPPALARAVEIWSQYQQHHDVAAHADDAVGIDNETGSVFFGQNVNETLDRARAVGITRPLYFIRLGRTDSILQIRRSSGRWRKVT